MPKYKRATGDYETEGSPAKTSKPKKTDKIRRLVIEPAENGFIITCEYESKEADGPCCGVSVPDEKKVASDFDGLYSILVGKLDNMYYSKS